jgi:hypothetical protein
MRHGPHEEGIALVPPAIEKGLRRSARTAVDNHGPYYRDQK